MEKGGMYVIRTYRCANGVIEKSKFWVPSRAVVRHGRVKGTTSAAKRDANARQAVRVLARKLNCNFTPRDLMITCTYDDENLTQLTDHKAQDRLTSNFLRRLKRALKKTGAPDPRVITVPSEIDGDSGKPVRPHLHMVISGAGIRFEDGRWYVGDKDLADIWQMGGVYTKSLYDQPDYTALALYLIRQGRQGENEKKYSCSRNMVEPVITEHVALTGRALRQPAKTVLMERGEYHAETGCDYIRYVAKKKEPPDVDA